MQQIQIRSKAEASRHFLVDVWGCGLFDRILKRANKKASIKSGFDANDGIACSHIETVNVLKEEVILSMIGPSLLSQSWTMYFDCYPAWSLPYSTKSVLESSSAMPVTNQRRAKSSIKPSAAVLSKELRKDLIDEHFLVTTYEYGEADGPCPKIAQPYKIIVHPQVGFVCDVHSHLSDAEVIGLLAGKWDPKDRCLYIQAPFPCTSTERRDDHGFTDVELDSEAEWKIREVIASLGLQVVGWYHSHPQFKPDPSVMDIFNQQQYQYYTRDQTLGLEPFVGLIVSTYDTLLPTPAANHQWFTVVPYSSDNNNNNSSSTVSSSNSSSSSSSSSNAYILCNDGECGDNMRSDNSNNICSPCNDNNDGEYNQGGNGKRASSSTKRKQHKHTSTATVDDIIYLPMRMQVHYFAMELNKKLPPTALSPERALPLSCVFPPHGASDSATMIIKGGFVSDSFLSGEDDEALAYKRSLLNAFEEIDWNVDDSESAATTSANITTSSARAAAVDTSSATPTILNLLTSSPEPLIDVNVEHNVETDTFISAVVNTENNNTSSTSSDFAVADNNVITVDSAQCDVTCHEDNRINEKLNHIKKVAAANNASNVYSNNNTDYAISNNASINSSNVPSAPLIKISLRNMFPSGTAAATTKITTAKTELINNSTMAIPPMCKEKEEIISKTCHENNTSANASNSDDATINNTHITNNNDTDTTDNSNIIPVAAESNYENAIKMSANSNNKNDVNTSSSADHCLLTAQQVINMKVDALLGDSGPSSPINADTATTTTTTVSANTSTEAISSLQTTKKIKVTKEMSSSTTTSVVAADVVVVVPARRASGRAPKERSLYGDFVDTLEVLNLSTLRKEVLINGKFATTTTALPSTAALSSSSGNTVKVKKRANIDINTTSDVKEPPKTVTYTSARLQQRALESMLNPVNEDYDDDANSTEISTTKKRKKKKEIMGVSDHINNKDNDDIVIIKTKARKRDGDKEIVSSDDEVNNASSSEEEDEEGEEECDGEWIDSGGGRSKYDDDSNMISSTKRKYKKKKKKGTTMTKQGKGVVNNKKRADKVVNDSSSNARKPSAKRNSTNDLLSPSIIIPSTATATTTTTPFSSYNYSHDSYSSFILTLQDTSKPSSALARELLFTVAPAYRCIMQSVLSMGFYYSRSLRRIDLHRKWRAGIRKIDKLQYSADIWAHRLGLGDCSSSSSSSGASAEATIKSDNELDDKHNQRTLDANTTNIKEIGTIRDDNCSITVDQNKSSINATTRFTELMVKFFELCWQDYHRNSSNSKKLEVTAPSQHSGTTKNKNNGIMITNSNNSSSNSDNNSSSGTAVGAAATKVLGKKRKVIV